MINEEWYASQHRETILEAATKLGRELLEKFGGINNLPELGRLYKDIILMAIANAIPIDNLADAVDIIADVLGELYRGNPFPIQAGIAMAVILNLKNIQKK